MCSLFLSPPYAHARSFPRMAVALLPVPFITMAREFAKAFYNSKEWQATRDLYIKSVDGLCENCLKKNIYRPGKVVHHIVHLSPANINNPDITLNPKNFMLVCQDCHAELHADGPELRYCFDEDGNVLPVKEDER